jgi:autotransporter strand-loop-strand O-heptosyltransferase
LSTAQAKFWNNPDGWDKVTEYLNSLGYDVVSIDKLNNIGSSSYINKIPSKSIDKTGDLPISDRINDLHFCEFFIGLGSGLSWLAWMVNKPVILISGFSDPKSEFYTPYRVHNKNVCNSCWNDTSFKFDIGKWDWCPRNKDFECSSNITFEMVKEQINKCISDIANEHSN